MQHMHIFSDYAARPQLQRLAVPRRLVRLHQHLLQAAALLALHRALAIGELRDEVVGEGEPAQLHDLGTRQLRVGKRDALEDPTVQEGVLLGQQQHLMAQHHLVVAKTNLISALKPSVDLE